MARARKCQAKDIVHTQARALGLDRAGEELARAFTGALFGHCSSCGFSSIFASLGRFYEFEK